MDLAVEGFCPLTTTKGLRGFSLTTTVEFEGFCPLTTTKGLRVLPPHDNEWFEGVFPHDNGGLHLLSCSQADISMKPLS
jgi:hypothetical protein